MRGSRTGKGTSSTRAECSVLDDCGFSRWGPGIKSESRVRGAITILGRIDNKVADNRILMNVILMMNEIPSIANPMVRKPALPDLGLAPDDRSEFMRIRALDELYATLKSHALSRREQQMNMVRHNNEGVQEVPALAAVVKQSFEK